MSFRICLKQTLPPAWQSTAGSPAQTGCGVWHQFIAACLISSLNLLRYACAQTISGETQWKTDRQPVIPIHIDRIARLRAHRNPA